MVSSQNRFLLDFIETTALMLLLLGRHFVESTLHENNLSLLSRKLKQ